MKLQYALLAGMLLVLTACEKDSVYQPEPLAPAENMLTLTINYEVDGVALLTDTTLYTTDAGYAYSVSTLKYYISELCLIKEDSSLLKILSYKYIDAAIEGKNTFALKDIAKGQYIGIRFNIGLDSLHNITGALPNISENNTMEWPVPMGGGYHFLKFEGHYIDSASTSVGFAMHLGTNGCLVKANALYKSISIDLATSSTTLNLTMNLNEWFRNPAIYDFDKDGNFSMGNMMAMKKLAKNGVDIFHYKN